MFGRTEPVSDKRDCTGGTPNNSWTYPSLSASIYAQERVGLGGWESSAVGSNGQSPSLVACHSTKLDKQIGIHYCCI
jgi:hypothetical protein